MGLNFPLMRREQAPLVGWFGKLPVIGDFAGRGLPSALREQVHAWCAQGMGCLTDRHGETWKAAFQLAPVWHFAMNANIWDARPLTGCMAPSMDRIGRCSPVVALRSVGGARMAECLPPQSRWLFRVENLLRHLVQGALDADAIQAELEAALKADSRQKEEGDSAADILSDLGISTGQETDWFSWPDLAERFCERKGRSFWWAEPSPQQPPRQIIHNGAPDDDLFELLMTGWAVMPGREHAG